MIRLEPRPQPSRALMLLSPAIAIALTLVAGGALMAAMGRPPGEALYIYFFQPFHELWLYLTAPPDQAAAWIYTPAEVVVKAIPLVHAVRSELCFDNGFPVFTGFTGKFARFRRCSEL